jgi:hypothetical protein
MKITKRQLRRIIKEEKQKLLREAPASVLEFEQIMHDMAEDGQGQWVARLESWFHDIQYDLPDPVADASIRWKTEG